MGDLIGLVVFALIAIFSAISNVQKKKNEQEQQEKQQGRRTRPEDLPEATRRMLYGDGAPREAVPREAQPRPVVPPRLKPVPLSQEGHSIPPVRRQTPPAQPHVPHGADPAEVARRRMREQMQKAAQQAKQREAQQQELRERAREEAEREKRRQQAAVLKEQNAVTIGNKKKQQSRVSRTQHGRLRNAVFGDMRDVRRAIILQEVLGPPKGLQP